MNETYWQRRHRLVNEKAAAEGLCNRCLKNKADAGRKTCADCRRGEVRKKRVEKKCRVRDGLCYKCGKKKPTPGMKSCTPCARKQNEVVKEARRSVRLAVMRHYSGGVDPWCRGCGETILVYLTIDHVDDNGAEHRRRTSGRSKYTDSLYRKVIRDGFRDRLQVLCWNCQWAKRLNGGICPKSGRDLRTMPTESELKAGPDVIQ